MFIFARNRKDIVSLLGEGVPMTRLLLIILVAATVIVAGILYFPKDKADQGLSVHKDKPVLTNEPVIQQ